MLSRRDFMKLTGAGLLATMLPHCSSSGEDIDRTGFGFHLNPVMLNGTVSGSETRISGEEGPIPEEEIYSYATPSGVRHIRLDPQGDLYKSYPTDEDYHRMKRIGGFVISNIWLHYWNDAQDGPEMRKVIDRCAGNRLRLIVRLEDVSRISNYPQAGPTDEQWFTETFEPYLRSIARYGIGKVWGYQVWNEAWEPHRYLLGPTGSMITNREYIDHLSRVQSILKAEDPSTIVTNSAMTSIVESDFYSRTKDLLHDGLEGTIDYFNFHYFTHGSVDADDELKLIQIDALLDKDVLVTETNHVVPTATYQEKFDTIMAVRKAVARWFKLRCLLAFAWNAGTADTDLLPWAIKDTPLEDMLYNAFNG